MACSDRRGTWGACLSSADTGSSADIPSGLPSEKLLNACSQLITTTQMITLRLEHEKRIEEPEQRKECGSALVTSGCHRDSAKHCKNARAITGEGAGSADTLNFYHLSQTVSDFKGGNS